jgi:hypothetical protein
MGIEELTAILESAIAVSLLIILLLKLWASLRLDEFRQRVFIVRDELFDFAAAGGIAFDHPAYKLLRQSMNGFIRYAHQLTWFRLICNLIRWQLYGEEKVFTWADRWEAAVETLEDDTSKRALQQFHTRTLSLVAERLVTGSPVLIVLVAGMVVVQLLRNQWINLRQLIPSAATGTVNRIVDPRFLEEEASRA